MPEGAVGTRVDGLFFRVRTSGAGRNHNALPICSPSRLTRCASPPKPRHPHCPRRKLINGGYAAMVSGVVNRPGDCRRRGRGGTPAPHRPSGSSMSSAASANSRKTRCQCSPPGRAGRHLGCHCAGCPIGHGKIIDRRFSISGGADPAPCGGMIVRAVDSGPHRPTMFQLCSDRNLSPPRPRSANHRCETLADITRRGFNVLVACECGHSAVLDARRLERSYRCQRRSTRCPCYETTCIACNMGEAGRGEGAERKLSQEVPRSEERQRRTLSSRAAA